MKGKSLFYAAICFIFFSCGNYQPGDEKDIILENETFKLVIGSNGLSKSLVYKPDNEECLKTGENVPVFTATQDRPFMRAVFTCRESLHTECHSDDCYVAYYAVHVQEKDIPENLVLFHFR